MTHKYVKGALDFFSKLQPEEDMREYVLSVFASMLDGYNKQNRFYIFTGPSGSNGKTTATNFFDLTLGNYASTVPHTLLTRKRGNASSATPELADKRGIRFLTLNEPDGEDEIHVGHMKELSGQDKIQARQLYGKPFYYVPQFKMLLICNDLPNIDSIDGGTWRRIRAIPWYVRFIDADQEITDPTREFYKDSEIAEKLKKWKRAFMWLLLKKYYPKVREHGITDPISVKKQTDEYKKNKDVFHEFISEQVEETKNMEDKITFKDLYNAYRSWCKDYRSIEAKKSMKDLEKYIKSSNKIPYRKHFLYGIKIRDEDEDDGEVDEGETCDLKFQLKHMNIKL